MFIFLDITGSSILTATESTLLYKNITGFSNSRLIYRATRDGFSASAYHQKVDGISNAIIIVKNNLNYVFGGFSQIATRSTSGCNNDPNSYLFLLRSNGASTSQRFDISNSIYAYCTDPNNLFWFGQGADIYINSNSNVNTGSYTYFCYSYKCPPGMSYGWTAQIYLSGNLNGWLTTEIEVYQMS